MPLIPEIDISVSKLLGFETFANFLRAKPILANLVSKKSLGLRKFGLGFGFGEFGLKKVSVFVLENLV